MLLLQNFFLKFKIFFLGLSSIFFLSLALYMKQKKMVMFFNWEFFFFKSAILELNFFVDFFCLFFSFSVLFIASSVLLFSVSYMQLEKYFLRFHLIVILFVVSMLMLIFSSNLVMLLLGWDGLGLVSYLLVIYFFSSKSSNAGLLTVMTNRVGDVFILLSLSIYLSQGDWHIWAHSNNSSFFWSGSLASLLILSSMTKSAQVPFSAWLPAAMAAPTPVSALVHSSTLVTAGVYLMFRFLPMLKFNFCLNFLFLSGSLTLVMAGVSALYESDMKKMVALSTLSQLGLMFCSLGSGGVVMTYFHLLSHAFFKAMLFISVGNMIHLSDDFQDLRKVTLSFSKPGFTFAFMLIANLSLMGMPFLAGFFSKDLILEIFFMDSSMPWLSMALFFLGCVLTSIYSLRFLFLTSWKVSKLSKSLLVKRDMDSQIFFSLSGLLSMAILSGSLLSWLLFSSPLEIFMPRELKLALLLILPLGIGAGVSFSLKFFSFQTASNCEWILGSLWGLPYFSTNLIFLEMKTISFTLSHLFDQTMNKKILMASWKNYQAYSFFFKFIKDKTYFNNFFFMSMMFFLICLV